MLLLTEWANLLTEWAKLLSTFTNKAWYEKVEAFLIEELKNHRVYPSIMGVNGLYNAYNLTPPDKVKIVIIGQDPYPNEHAHGLAFSTTMSRLPVSLRTIYKEIKRTYPDFNKTDGDLTYWAEQGVLLLNTILTVRENQPLSHKGIGWEELTGETVRVLYNNPNPIVFMLWGRVAQEFFRTNVKGLAPNPLKLVLESYHPATAGYGNDRFAGCDHFRKANKFLIEHNLTPIEWVLKKHLESQEIGSQPSVQENMNKE